MIHRTTAVSREVGEPFELISAKPPPMTSAAKATMAQTSEPLRALLQKNRDRERSGFEPFVCWPDFPLRPYWSFRPGQSVMRAG